MIQPVLHYWSPEDLAEPSHDNELYQTILSLAERIKDLIPEAGRAKAMHLLEYEVLNDEVAA